MVCRRSCVSASAIAGAAATSVWLSSDIREEAIKAGKFVSAIWLKVAPNRAIARMATPLCVTAKRPMSASPARMVSATLFGRDRLIGRPLDRDSPPRSFGRWAEAGRSPAHRRCLPGARGRGGACRGVGGVGGAVGGKEKRGGVGTPPPPPPRQGGKKRRLSTASG